VKGWWKWALVGAAVVIPSVVLAGVGYWLVDREVNDPYQLHVEPQDLERSPEERSHFEETYVVLPIPPPADGTPTIGEEGETEHGYPLQRIDRVGMVALLHHERFDRLTEIAEEEQAAFDEDFRNEYRANDAVAAFGNTDPRLAPLLDAWVEHSPRSFAPYAARAHYHYSLAWKYRGTRLMGAVRDDELAAMHSELDQASEDIGRALSREPRALAVLTLRQSIANMTGSDADELRAFEDALSVCRTCMTPYTTRLGGLIPRWGGSHAAMDEVAQQAARHGDDNPWLRTLVGAADLDRCRAAIENENVEAARAACERARSRGDRELTHERMAALHYFLTEDYDAALEEIEAASRYAPQGHLKMKALILAHLERWEESALAYVALARLKPSNLWVLEYASTAGNHLQVAAWEHFDAGDRWKALDMLDMALGITPGDRDLQQRLNHVILTASDPGEKTVEELAQIAEDNPDSFQAHRDYDYALGRTDRYAEIAEMWDAFIDAHPWEGRAYLERAGARRRLQHPETTSDLERGCQLGIAQSCVYSSRFQ
jgi:tetratricopeptide (TPR) repeat protein